MTKGKAEVNAKSRSNMRNAADTTGWMKLCPLKDDRSN
jgi:hypothetical protein